MNTKVLTYADTNDQKHVVNAATDFFDNSDAEACPISKCELLKSDCKAPNGNSALKVDASTF